MSGSPFTAAVVQMRSTTDMTENVEAMDAAVREAAAQGATYIQTPEMTGLVQASRKPFFQQVVAEDNDPVAARAAALAKELGVTLHIGSTPVLVSEGRAANRALIYSPSGELLARYDKIHMFDVDLDNGESWRESAVYEPGREAVMVEIADALFGIAICYDCRFPELHTAYAKAGCTVLTGPSCFTRQTGGAHWHTLLRSRAIETGSWMIAAAQGGDMADGRETYGHSLIIDPWGVVVAEVTGEEPGIALAEIDPAAALAARQKIPNLKNGRAFELKSAAATLRSA
ncbi:carbon-nitrogen hydrolase family protein [Ahrensia sp. R2A130]|uniref:carbon-nitrogen hydrolase family protein n=1 Tax=Ahrensia sp. R2A130 TaxID=744979 RepID=UPI0001E0D8A2|nr:carbon-nitrogen hydrolase family protein [Ahrensia sp. R2A130]EFL87951.1 hydrolase [Ahrensia sp. R2A130]